MRLGMHTYSLYHHGIAENWAGFKLPWKRQITLIEVMNYIKTLGLEGLHLDAKALDKMDNDYFEQIKQYASSKNLYIELDLECPVDNMEQALEMERSALKRSIRYCRNELKIGGV